MASRVSLTSRGGGVSLALIGRPSSDGVTIKIPYGVDFYYTDQSRTQSYLFLLVAVITVNAYPFLAFSDLTCHLEDTGI